MANRNAVIYTFTGSLLRSGFCDFLNDGSFDATSETQVAVNDGAIRPPNVDIKYVKVVAGEFVEMSAAEKLIVNQVNPPPLSSELPLPHLVDGYTSTNSTNFVSIRGTIYNEQTVNGQRSIVSTSANDSSAGTGARKVQLRYFDQAMVGPWFEIVTLNGLTPVNTQALDICFIERMDVVEVGSQLGNLGTITLKTGLAGAGTDIGVIAAGDNETNWCHHYIPLNDPIKLSEVVGTNKGTVLGDLHARVAYPLTITRPEVTVLPTLRLVPGETLIYQPNPPVQVVGPTRVTLYIKPVSATMSDWAASIGYYEED